MSDLNIHKKYLLAFPSDKVFNMWASPTATVSPVTAIRVEPQVGGTFELFVNNSQEPQMIGKFLEFTPPSKLIYTWEWNRDGEVSQVHVEFRDVQEGTEVVIDHTGFDKERSRESHDKGWDSYIDGLTSWLEDTE